MVYLTFLFAYYTKIYRYTYIFLLFNFQQNKNKEENFCPLKVELTTTSGNLFVTDTKIADGLVKSVPPQNLIYQCKYMKYSNYGMNFIPKFWNKVLKLIFEK